MNRWECDHPDCSETVVGCGGAVGLRAIGWFFERGPRLFCPRHRPDILSGDCWACVSDVQAWHLQLLVAANPIDHYPVCMLEHVHARELDAGA